MQLTERVLVRLETAETKELDPWMRDDIRIAWITTLYASQGNPQPHVDATYRVLGLHPDKVWPAILARRDALLGSMRWAEEIPAREGGGTSDGVVLDAPVTTRPERAPAAPLRSAPSYLIAQDINQPQLSPKKPCASERRLAPRKKAV